MAGLWPGAKVRRVLDDSVAYEESCSPRGHTVLQMCWWASTWHRTPANDWAGQLNVGWSKNGHANSVAAVQFRVVASGCGPNAFARFGLFRNDVVQIKLNAFLCRSSVKSLLGCFFGCTMPRRTVQHHHVCTRTPCWHCWAWVMLVGCCAEACTAAVLIGVMHLPGCPFGSAWCLVCGVRRLGRLG